MSRPLNFIKVFANLKFKLIDGKFVFMIHNHEIEKRCFCDLHIEVITQMRSAEQFLERAFQDYTIIKHHQVFLQDNYVNVEIKLDKNCLIWYSNHRQNVIHKLYGSMSYNLKKRNQNDWQIYF